MKEWYLFTEERGPFTYRSPDNTNAEKLSEWICKTNSWFTTERHGETVIVRGSSIVYFQRANQNVAF